MPNTFRSRIDMSHPALGNVTDDEINNVTSELIAAIDLMVPDRPYEADFLVWPLWQKCPPSHHRALGLIVSAIVQAGFLPIKQDRRNTGSTRLKYFLLEE